ncbi:3-hydroxyacyl-CoA dehydrogenase [Rhizobiales bacterium GAS191]|nr:3-hydroxyacyl-CoA dehydrogenase [Rhizobiales bacterium GAS191]
MARVAIIGTGFVGRAWAISYARAGHDVVLWDEVAEAPRQALDFMRMAVPELAQNGLTDGQSAEAVLARVGIESELAAALAGVAYVQESTPERVEVKRDIFSQLDRLAPADAVLASSTSAILPSRFTEHLPGRHRCLVVHPINPPYLVPAAEVVPAPWTSPDIVERTRAFLVAAGHAPIVMKRELSGFVMNRLQAALLEEAFRLVEGGYASIEDVDIGIREGLALRWSFMGPFETIDLNAPAGVRDYVTRYKGIFEELFGQMQWRADWTGKVLDTVERERRALLPQEKLAERGLWRDRRLMALAAHKRRAASEIG